MKVAVFRINKDGEEFKDIKKKYKLFKLDDNKPEMKLFPNDLTGAEKITAMMDIPFDKGSKNLKEIYDEISSGMNHEI